MSAPAPTPEFCPLGIDGILVRFGRVLSDAANARALAFRDTVEISDLAGVTEVASSLTSVRVGFDPTRTNRATLTEQLQKLVRADGAGIPEPRRRWDIPVAFGGDFAPQLAEAALLAGLTMEQAIHDITSQIIRVIAIGFAPGQPYLGMLPQRWDIPRQNTLTESLPRGALIVAVRQLIIWAADAPTGWRHVGQTAFRVYRPEQDDAFAFAPGDLVRFNQVSDDTMRDLQASGDANGGATCTVLR